MQKIHEKLETDPDLGIQQQMDEDDEDQLNQKSQSDVILDYLQEINDYIIHGLYKHLFLNVNKANKGIDK